MIKVDMQEEDFWRLFEWSVEHLDEPEGQLLYDTLHSKADKMINRQLYVKYKTEPTVEQREVARQEYLDRQGIHPDFRW